MAVDEKLQRQVMGRFATGVTVVTTRTGDEMCGMTANAVMSLSLDPPLIVVSVEKTAHMHGALLESRCFAVNVLKQEQESLSRRFARKGPKDFSDLSCTVEETGSPILDDGSGDSAWRAATAAGSTDSRGSASTAATGSTGSAWKDSAATARASTATALTAMAATVTAWMETASMARAGTATASKAKASTAKTDSAGAAVGAC